MEEDRMPKKIFTQELEVTRRRGRPWKIKKEEVERDLQVLGVRRWRELVADRKKKRKDIVRQAKAHSGLQCQWKKNPIKNSPSLWDQEDNYHIHSNRSFNPILSHINPVYVVTFHFKIDLGKERYELELNRSGINFNNELQMLRDAT